MYCGTEMPSPAPASAAAMPEDLDALVRQALSTGRADKVRRALESRPVAPAAPASPGPVAVPAHRLEPLPPAGSFPAPTLAPALDVAPLDLDGGVVFDALAANAARARAAYRSGDTAGAVRILTEVDAGLREARAVLGTVTPDPPAVAGSADREATPAASPEPPRVELPPYRHPWMLVVEGAGDASRARTLAEAMGVDLTTATQVALSPSPRVALRGAERLVLDRKAGRIQAIAGLRAAVVTHDDLRALPDVQTVLRAGGVRRVSVTDDPAWRKGEPPPPPEVEKLCDTSGVVIAVPGDVVVRRYRLGLDGGRGKGQAVRVAGESRVAVLDLHGPACFVRIVQGVTDLKGMPGHDGQSTLRSMRGLVDRLWQWWPRAQALPPRTARPGDTPSLDEVSEQPDGLALTGWAEWEEHSRLARILAGLD